MVVLFLDGEFTVLYLLSQVFAFGDVVFSLVAVQRRKKVKLLWLNTLASLCGVIHYALLEAWSGTLTKIISTTRNGLATYEASKKKTSRFIPIIFVAIYVVIGIYSFENWVSILPIAAASIYTVAIYRVDASRIRKFALLGTTLWLLYNICVVSVVGIIGDSIIIINDLVAIYRFRGETKMKLRKQS